MEENLGAFEEKRNEAAETAESAGKGGKHLAKGGKRGWAIAGIALGVLAAAYLGLCAYATLSGTIYPNTTVGGVDYGGMTEEQAAAELTLSVGLSFLPGLSLARNSDANGFFMESSCCYSPFPVFRSWQLLQRGCQLFSSQKRLRSPRWGMI